MGSRSEVARMPARRRGGSARRLQGGRWEVSMKLQGVRWEVAMNLQGGRWGAVVWPQGSCKEADGKSQ